MVGDQQDMLGRIKAMLPGRWFADDTPVLDVIVGGVAFGWAWVYQLLAFARAATRIATATGVWLDMIAEDFFGNRLVRRPGQGDDPFRIRIKREIFRERGTRGAITGVLTDTSGRAPTIFEPSRTTDTGGYGSMNGAGGGLAYGSVGGWGSLDLPFQCFVTAYRAVGTGIANVNGYTGSAGGYGVGAFEYAALAMIEGQTTDPEIQAAIAGVMPAAAVAWTTIANGPTTPAAPGQVQGLSVVSRTMTTADLIWAAPSDGVAVLGYAVLYQLAGAAQWELVAVGITRTQYTVAGCLPGMNYRFRILPTNAAGPGPISASVDVTMFATALVWGVMPPGVTYRRGTGGIPVNLTTSPNPPGVNFGWSSSPVVPPTSTTPGGLFNGNYWGDYLNAPAIPGSYYLWALASDGSGQLVSGPISIT